MAPAAMTGRRLIALLAPTGLAGVLWWLYQVRSETALLFLLGILLGFGLQRSRFCVAAAFRDPVLFGLTGPARALLLALALSSVGFGWLQHRTLAAGEALPGNLYSITLATVIGALLFGIGTVPAGGCAITTLLRVGEGHLKFAWTLGGLFLGALVGARHWGWWNSLSAELPAVHLPAVLGWGGTAAAEAALLGSAYLALLWWERKGGARL